MNPDRSSHRRRSPRRLAWTIHAAVLVVFLFLLNGSDGQAAETLTVGGSGGFASIGEALNAAAPGDTVEVGAGEYPESVVIEKSLVLSGHGLPRVLGSHQGDVVLVLADDVTVQGFEIRGSGNDMMVSNAGIKVKGDRVRLLGNTIEDNLFGIYLDGARQTLVEGNRIRGRSEVDIGRRGAGIHLYDAHHNTVRRNTVSYVRDGVYFDHSDYNRVEDNHFSELRYGVHYMYCHDNGFYRNVFRDSIAGVAVMYTERVTFADNQIFDNRKGYNAFGLLLKECIDSVAERNLIVNNVRGVFLDSSHRNLLRNNLIAYNDVGVELYASSLENRFSANDFVGNLTTLHTVGRAKADWTPGGVGNYYWNYRGYDLDGDGRGDVRHRLQDAFEYLEGRRPLLRLFLNSAAADALAAAEESFPLVPSSEQQDLAPWMKPVSGVSLNRQASRDQGFPVFMMLSVLSLAVGGWAMGRLSR